MGQKRERSFSSSTSHQPADSEQLTIAQTRLLREPKFADLTITCQGRTWKCQRSILCDRSDFFNALCNGKFKEAAAGVIDLPDDDSEGVDSMLLYLYTLQLPDFDDINIHPQRLQHATRVHRVTDKYCVEPLRLAAKEYMLRRINNELPKCRSSSPIFQSAWIHHVKNFWLWEGSDGEELSTAVINALVKTTTIIENAGFQVLMSHYPEFNLAFVRALAMKARENEQVERLLIEPMMLRSSKK